jgi:hypothetical protein
MNNAPNQSPKPTLESIAALRGSFSGSAAWLKRYRAKTKLGASCRVKVPVG